MGVKRNLPPPAEPWGRDVEQRLRVLETQTSRALQDNTNALKGVNSAVSGLTKQVQAIDDLTQGLVTVTDELAQVVAELPVPVSDSETLSGFQARSGERALFSVTLDVPEGKSKASFFAVIQGWYFSESEIPLSDVASFYIGIGSWRSDPALMVLDKMDSYQVFGSAARSASVNPGGTVNVTCYSIAGPTLAGAVPANTLTLSALVVFS